MLVENSEDWRRIVRKGEGYVFNDFGTQFPGDSPTWNARDFNKLHRASCSQAKRMTHISEGKLTKYYFQSREEAIDWLVKNRGEQGYTLCYYCKP